MDTQTATLEVRCDRAFQLKFTPRRVPTLTMWAPDKQKYVWNIPLDKLIQFRDNLNRLVAAAEKEAEGEGVAAGDHVKVDEFPSIYIVAVVNGMWGLVNVETGTYFQGPSGADAFAREMEGRLTIVKQSGRASSLRLLAPVKLND